MFLALLKAPRLAWHIVIFTILSMILAIGVVKQKANLVEGVPRTNPQGLRIQRTVLIIQGN